MLLLEYKYDDFYSVFFQSLESNHGVFTKPLYCVTKVVSTYFNKRYNCTNLVLKVVVQVYIFNSS